MVDNKEQLKDFLRQSVLNNLERGHWRFRSSFPYTDVKIPDWVLAQNAEAWCHLLADLVLQHHTGAILGNKSNDPDDAVWVPRIAKVFEARGIEVPFTQIEEDTYLTHTWGENPDRYPNGFPVSVFANVTTLGDRLEYLKKTAEIYYPNLKVVSAFSLIDRNPDSVAMIDGIPHNSVMHIPLPLYRNGVELGRSNVIRDFTRVLCA